MRPVAKRRVLRMLAGAKIGGTGLFRRIGLRNKTRAGMAAVAIRLVAAQAAGTPIDDLAGFNLDLDGGILGYRRFHFCPT